MTKFHKANKGIILKSNNTNINISITKVCTNLIKFKIKKHKLVRMVEVIPAEDCKFVTLLRRKILEIYLKSKDCLKNALTSPVHSEFYISILDTYLAL